MERTFGEFAPRAFSVWNFLPCCACFCARRIHAALVGENFCTDRIGVPFLARACGIVDFALLFRGEGSTRCGGVFILIPYVVRRDFGGVLGAGRAIVGDWKIKRRAMVGSDF